MAHEQPGRREGGTSDPPEAFDFPQPDMERALAVIRAALGPTILPRGTDPVVGALWLAELGRRRSILAAGLTAEADALMEAASHLLRRHGQLRA